MLKDHSGSYLVDGVVANEQAADYAKDAELQEKLWTISEKLVGHSGI